MIVFNTGPRPDFITEQDLERWDCSIARIKRTGTAWETFMLMHALGVPGGREHFYAGEWLGEQLRARGLPVEKARPICQGMGRAVANGAQSWPEAQRIMSAFDWLEGKTDAEAQQ